MSLDRRLLEEALPNYDLGAELGRGGWGIVYEATHRSLTRPVAVKVLPRAFASDVEVSTRFSEEARVVAALDHPHLVAVYDFLQHEGMLIIVMERLGSSLWDRMCRTGVAPDEAIAIALAMCAALAEAHAVDCIHRDVKPENILFTAAGLPKLTDFGVAKIMGRSQPGLTQAGDAIGTPAYMAPEQATGKGIGPATDIYALATVLFELLSGDLPFPGADTAAAELFQRVHEPPVELTSIAAVDDRLAGAVMGALATDPADRPATATEFGVQLASVAATLFGSGWLERSGVPVRADQRIMRAAVGSTTAPHDRPRGSTIGPLAAGDLTGVALEEDTLERDDERSRPAASASPSPPREPTGAAPASPPSHPPAPASPAPPAPAAVPPPGADDAPSPVPPAAPSPAPAEAAPPVAAAEQPPRSDAPRADGAGPEQAGPEREHGDAGPDRSADEPEPPAGPHHTDAPDGAQSRGSIAALAAASRSGPVVAPARASDSGPADLPPGHPEVTGPIGGRSVGSIIGSVVFVVLLAGAVLLMFRSGWFSSGGSSDAAATTTTTAATDTSDAAASSTTVPAATAPSVPGALDAAGAPIPAAAIGSFLGACEQFAAGLGLDAAGAAEVCGCTLDGVSGQIETEALESSTAALTADAGGGSDTSELLIDQRIVDALTACVQG
ncbi:MAG: serine/threonine-protein kinase [Actinomycetota bacterium]|nr:serine/threonine-protein kinase [Actinomycetota bacterium]